MVNYDLPWNPNRLEQRFGRIHRIGQTEVCHLWNLVARETREGMVFQRLFHKLEEERAALGGKVFDILGKMTFDNRSLRDLLIEAVRYGNDPNVRARLTKVVDLALDKDKLRRLLEERALTDDSMDTRKIMRIRREMERAEAHKLQPHFIQAFFLEAFRIVGGKIHPREHGRFEITAVPFAVRNRDMQIGFGESVLNRYERVCFDKEDCSVPGLTPAALICPGHPLLEATIDLIRERYADVLKRGAMFIDESDSGSSPRLLFYIESSIQDGRTVSNGDKRVISRRVHFVELREDGTAENAGYAPYLDYRAVSEDEQSVLREWLSSQKWLCSNVEDRAYGYAVSQMIPEHFAEVKKRRFAALDKIAKAVKERMTAEIRYWDFRAADLKQKEAAGKGNPRLNSGNAERRAEELEARMQKRLAELEAERNISAMPPVIVGGSLVIPLGLMCRLTGKPLPAMFGQNDRQAVEAAAMKAVMDIETRLGFLPRDVSAERRGYDIESEIPEDRRTGDGCLRCIEVKGRVKGADTVTITRNEVAVGLNKRDRQEAYFLAIVEVDGDKTRTVYLKDPFHKSLEKIVASANYKLMDLIQGAEIAYQE